MTPVPDPENISGLRIFLSFTIVFGLIAAMGFILKYIAAKGLQMPGSASRAGKRLQIVESLALDARRRLVIVVCDDSEHLLLLGPGQDIVVETNLKKKRS